MEPKTVVITCRLRLLGEQELGADAAVLLSQHFHIPSLRRRVGSQTLEVWVIRANPRLGEMVSTWLLVRLEERSVV